MKRIWTPEEGLREIRARELVREIQGRLVRPTFFMGSRSAGGGGGGGGIAFNEGLAQGFEFEVTSGVTSDFTASGSNRFMFAAVGGLNPSEPAPTLSSCLYGGSGGTTIPPMSGAAQNFCFSAGSANSYSIAPGPTGATNVYATFSSLGIVIGGVCYTGVEQATPYDSDQVTADDVESNTAVATATVTGLSSGDIVIARVFSAHPSNDGLAFSAVAGTTIRRQSSGTSTSWNRLCFLEKVSAGSSCTIEVNANQTGAGPLGWAMHAIRLRPAA